MLAPAPLARAAEVRAGRLCARAGIADTLARIAARDAAVNAFTATYPDRALTRAAALDAQRADRQDPGPLAGLAFGAKALFDVAGHTTLAGSALWRGRPPAARDATAIARLEAAGAILVGSLNMDEFASGFTTENNHHGATRNPHDPACTAGGSSGGSAAAVAAGMVPLALATDTNGSIRVPAAACGVWGLKPTYGRLSRAGAALFAESFDHVGPIAADLDTLRTAYVALQGADPADPAMRVDPPDAPASLLPMRIACAAGPWFDRCDAPAAAARQAAAALDAGADVALPGIAAGWSAAVVITLIEGASIHIDDLRRDPAGFDPMTRDRFLAGALMPAETYLVAQRARRLWHARALAALADTDVLITPALPFAPPPLGCDALDLKGLTVDPRSALGHFTQPFSAIGLPALVVPLAGPNPDGDPLPRAVQLVAKPWREDHLFAAAHRLVAAGLAAAHIRS